MATLQKIRSRGALVVIAIGLALFAFLLSDAWKTLQPHQIADAAVVNGEKVSYQDYQKIVGEYTEAIKLMRGNSSFTEDELKQINDEAWSSYINSSLIKKESEKIGIAVSDKEFLDVLSEGSHPLLRQTPFVNSKTGLFDKDMLNGFLVEYESARKNKSDIANLEQYSKIYDYWKFIEKGLKETLLANKYQTLIANAILSNPIEAKSNFDSRNNTYDIDVVAIPYYTIADSAVSVSKSEIESLYNKRKEEFRQFNETRDIKYVDVLVRASEEDRAEIEKEVAEATSKLSSTQTEYSTILRNAKSTLFYSEIPFSKSVYPADVVARLDSVKAVGQVYGPYYNATDNTINSFKLVGKEVLSDSIQYRVLSLYDADDKKKEALSDSVYNAIKGGANFEDAAKRYGQTGRLEWLSSSNYEGYRIDNENVKFIKLLQSTPAGSIVKSNLGQADVIVQVVAKKANSEKYKLAVIKRPVEFSKETYSKAYNEFSQFIAANNTFEKINKAAEEAGYKLLERKDLQTVEHTIGGVTGTKDALRWAFKAKEGEVSTIYECGNNDHIMAIALERINPEGYRKLDDVKDLLVAEIQKEKKAKLISDKIASIKSTELSKYLSLEGAVSDSLKLVSFSAPAYVSELRSTEPVISAYAAVAKENVVSPALKGNAGVLILKKLGSDTQNENFVEADEEKSIVNKNIKFISRTLFVDLYQKAKIKDNRYLFF